MIVFNFFLQRGVVNTSFVTFNYTNIRGYMQVVAPIVLSGSSCSGTQTSAKVTLNFALTPLGESIVIGILFVWLIVFFVLFFN